jgi:outer membrane usher protein
VSAYLNLHLGAAYVSQNAYGGAGFEAPTIDFDGAVRIGPYVLEAEGAFGSPGSQWFSPSYFQNYIFYRRGTRLVYDLPDEAIRVRVGDVSPEYTGLQTAPDLLGISADVAYAQLQPQKSIRPTGAHSFRVERPSNVDILVDNVLMKRIRLGPGNYNLTDLPLNPGANNVKLVIEDDAGQRQTLEFTGFSGQELLSPGINEWSVNAGFKSYDTGTQDSGSDPRNTTLVHKNSANSFYAQRQYFFNQPAVTGFYRTGILDWLTANSNLQADTDVAMAGAGIAAQTIDGFFTAKLAASDTYEGGAGFAIQLGYDYDKFNWFGYNSTFRLIGEYRTHDFETVGTYMSQVNYSAYLAATYAQHLPWSLTGGVSFSYYFVDHSSASDPGNRWQADASISAPLWDNVLGSISFSYGRDQTADANACCAYNQNGFQAFLRLAWIPDAHANASASYDSRSQTVQTTYSQSSETTGVGSWSATAMAETHADGRNGVSASASNFANRAEFYFNHAGSFDGLAYSGPFNPYSTQERSAVGVGTSLVYADGAWGMGRPVTSGFALITPHESLQGSPVVVGGTDSRVAETDWLGPAVVPNASPYRPARVTYDAPSAPAGYDLGSAAFDMKAPYKAGYSLKAGSAYTVTATGKLLDAEGQPLPLLGGEAREANKENGRKVELFTNRAGSFGAQGLAPGKWIIEMPTDPGPSRYDVEIPEGVTGLHNVGALKPSGVQQKPPVIEAEADNATN